MSGSEALFTAALGVSGRWQATDIRFEPEAGEIHCQTHRQADQQVHLRKERRDFYRLLCHWLVPGAGGSPAA